MLEIKNKYGDVIKILYNAYTAKLEIVIENYASGNKASIDLGMEDEQKIRTFFENS